jgi:hypothetical protein
MSISSLLFPDFLVKILVLQSELDNISTPWVSRHTVTCVANFLHHYPSITGTCLYFKSQHILYQWKCLFFYMKVLVHPHQFHCHHILNSILCYVISPQDIQSINLTT